LPGGFGGKVGTGVGDGIGPAVGVVDGVPDAPGVSWCPGTSTVIGVSVPEGAKVGTLAVPPGGIKKPIGSAWHAEKPMSKQTQTKVRAFCLKGLERRIPIKYSQSGDLFPPWYSIATST